MNTNKSNQHLQLDIRKLGKVPTLAIFTSRSDNVVVERIPSSVEHGRRVASCKRDDIRKLGREPCRLRRGGGREKREDRESLYPITHQAIATGHRK